MGIMRRLGFKRSSLFTPYEQEILKKYIYGAEIESEEDERVLDRYAHIGFVEFGSMFNTAILTQLGKNAL